MRIQAQFSDDRRYRYVLRYQWKAGGTVAFILLNPSTADEEHSDPTVTKCIKYAISWGFQEMCVLNLFALRSADPKALYQKDDPVGPDNDRWIREVLPRCAKVVCGWGTRGVYRRRDNTVLELIRSLGHEPLALAVTKKGYPGHPLYLPTDLRPAHEAAKRQLGGRGSAHSKR